MDSKSVKLEYIDSRPLFFPRLTYYRGGLTLPRKENIITVSDGEKKTLLKFRNGDKPSFKEIKEKRHEATSWV